MFSLLLVEDKKKGQSFWNFESDKRVDESAIHFPAHLLRYVAICVTKPFPRKIPLKVCLCGFIVIFDFGKSFCWYFIEIHWIYFWNPILLFGFSKYLYYFISAPGQQYLCAFFKLHAYTGPRLVQSKS